MTSPTPPPPRQSFEADRQENGCYRIVASFGTFCSLTRLEKRLQKDLIEHIEWFMGQVFNEPNIQILNDSLGPYVLICLDSIEDEKTWENKEGNYDLLEECFYAACNHWLSLFDPCETEE